MTWQGFVDRFYAHCTRDSNARVELGLSDRLGDLPDPSLEHALGEREATRALLADLHAVDTSGLDFHDRLDAELAALQLEREIHDHTYRFNGRCRLEQTPKAGDEIGDPILTLILNDPRPVGDRLRDIASRVEQIPGYLNGMLGRLTRPVTRWKETELEQVEGLDELFGIARQAALQAQWPDSRRLERAIGEAGVALEGYARQLRGIDSEDALAVGAQTTAEIVRLRGIDSSLDELPVMARDFLEETTATLRELRATLAPKYGLPGDVALADLHTELNRRFRVADFTPDGVLERYEQERQRLIGWIGERSLFPIPDAQDMGILPTPAFLQPAIPAGAMFPPPAFREGVRRSLVLLTLPQEQLAHHTELSIPNMMIHEGIPGHHLQLAWAALHRSPIRRQYDSAAHAEGWTTRLEDYMLDEGYLGDLTDEARFCAKRDISRIGARVVIDLFFMTGERRFLDVGVDCEGLDAERPFDAAGALLAAVTGFSPGRVRGELSWYSRERGYPLSYLSGNRDVLALEADVKAANPTLDDRERARRFHRLYLESGNMPLGMLRRVFEHEGLL